MIYLEGLMHKKINIFLALLIMAIITIIFAWVISAQAMSGIGVNILTPPIKCTPDPDAATCLISCPLCGSLATCSSLFQVQAIYLGGQNSLYLGQAFCLFNPKPPNGGRFHPGGQCLGNIFGKGPHFLINFGCR